jgi:hypothetical protein
MCEEVSWMQMAVCAAAKQSTIADRNSDMMYHCQGEITILLWSSLEGGRTHCTQGSDKATVTKVQQEMDPTDSRELHALSHGMRWGTLGGFKRPTLKYAILSRGFTPRWARSRDSDPSIIERWRF